jgi:stress response protein YsnF
MEEREGETNQPKMKQRRRRKEQLKISLLKICGKEVPIGFEIVTSMKIYILVS